MLKVLSTELQPPVFLSKWHTSTCLLCLTALAFFSLQVSTGRTCAGTLASVWTEATPTSATARLATLEATVRSRWTSVLPTHVRMGPHAQTTWEATHVRYGWGAWRDVDLVRMLLTLCA